MWTFAANELGKKPTKRRERDSAEAWQDEEKSPEKPKGKEKNGGVVWVGFFIACVFFVSVLFVSFSPHVLIFAALRMMESQN